MLEVLELMQEQMESSDALGVIKMSEDGLERQVRAIQTGTSFQIYPDPFLLSME